jgi:hypothetical protein
VNEIDDEKEQIAYLCWSRMSKDGIRRRRRRRCVPTKQFMVNFERERKGLE